MTKFEEAPLSQILEIDTTYDDGNLTTGRFQTIAVGRHSEIVER